MGAHTTELPYLDYSWLNGVHKAMGWKEDGDPERDIQAQMQGGQWEDSMVQKIHWQLNA